MGRGTRTIAEALRPRKRDGLFEVAETAQRGLVRLELLGITQIHGCGSKLRGPPVRELPPCGSHPGNSLWMKRGNIVKLAEILSQVVELLATGSNGCSPSATRVHWPPAPHDISNHEIRAEARLENELVRSLIDFDVRNR
jgi:hypothetical protein